jgi:fructosamine-3-kinase
MELTEAIAVVRQHNRWRRDHDGIEFYDPKRLGVALDTICDHAETMGQLKAALDKALAENLAMRDKLKG